MKVPIGHFDTSEHTPEEIADIVGDRIDRLMEPEDETKHLPGRHNQMAHGSWARDTLGAAIERAEYEDESIPFYGLEMEGLGLSKAPDEAAKRAFKHWEENVASGSIVHEEGGEERYARALEENTVSVIIQPDELTFFQRWASQQGTGMYLDKMDGDEPETFEDAEVAWDPETDTHVLNDGYHRVAAMLAAGFRHLQVRVPLDSPLAERNMFTEGRRRQRDADTG